MSENQQTENQTPEALTQDARASENQTAKIQTEELQASECNDLPEKTAKHSHTDELWKFISETRKISVPIIVAVYTVIVVFITLSAQYAYDVFTIKEEQQISIEDIITADEEEYFLEKDTETEISEIITVMYRGYDFKNTVTAQNADEYAYVYENTTENNTYLDVVFEYTNLGSNPIQANKIMSMTAETNGFQYTSFCAVETDGNTNIDLASNMDIQPEETAVLHFIFDVPRMYEKSDIPIIAKATICNEEYIVEIR